MTQSDANRPLAKAAGTYSETTIDDEVVVMSLATGDFFSLTGTARAIWQQLDGAPTRAGLIAALAKEFGAEQAAIEPDCDAFLAQLLTAGLLVRH